MHGEGGKWWWMLAPWHNFPQHFLPLLCMVLALIGLEGDLGIRPKWWAIQPPPPDGTIDGVNRKWRGMVWCLTLHSPLSGCQLQLVPGWVAQVMGNTPSNGSVPVLWMADDAMCGWIMEGNGAWERTQQHWCTHRDWKGKNDCGDSPYSPWESLQLITIREKSYIYLGHWIFLSYLPWKNCQRSGIKFNSSFLRKNCCGTKGINAIVMTSCELSKY